MSAPNLAALIMIRIVSKARNIQQLPVVQYPMWAVVVYWQTDSSYMQFYVTWMCGGYW